MAGGLGQYIKDTRGELRHVAWPTRTQTIVYTIFVAAISVATALYLGLFDYIFTGTLKRVVEASGASSAPQVTQQAAPSTSTAPILPIKIPTKL